jgi:triphosphoribosyl-dephospho-CoA synthase
MSAGQLATLACLLEVSAPKPGNVHRGADFEDLTFVELAASGVAIGSAMDASLECSIEQPRLGRLVLAGVGAMNAACGQNAYLGTILLMAPLALARRESPLAKGVAEVLSAMNSQDAADVYEAIRRARPGGLNDKVEHDIRGTPPNDLLIAMQAAADRDLVARQYVNGFGEVLGEAAPCIEQSRAAGLSISAAIIHAHVTLMSRYGDSLIARKCGPETSQAAAIRAQRVLDAGPPESEDYLSELTELDFWLRSDGHRRNPGTTADLIAAALFALLLEGRLLPPWR